VCTLPTRVWSRRPDGWTRSNFSRNARNGQPGSKVCQIRSVEFAGKYNVPLRVPAQFSRRVPGTLIPSRKVLQWNNPLFPALPSTGDGSQTDYPRVMRKHARVVSRSWPDQRSNIEVEWMRANDSRDKHHDFTFNRASQMISRKPRRILRQWPKTSGLVVAGDSKIAKVSIVGGCNAFGMRAWRARCSSRCPMTHQYSSDFPPQKSRISVVN